MGHLFSASPRYHRSKLKCEKLMVEEVGVKGNVNKGWECTSSVADLYSSVWCKGVLSIDYKSGEARA